MDKLLQFASDSSSVLSEDQLLCSICLDVFTDPVTTPCGHNFCKTCLTQYWEMSQLCVCPLCKEKFSKRPQLKINTTLREVVDHFKKKSPVEKPEVLCDACTGVKQKALKSCLDCGVTFCESHLEPHNTVPNLKKHKLINPVKNLNDYICQKHEKPLEMFCRDDQMCVCQFCTDGDHKNHNIVPIEEEIGEAKMNLVKTKTEVQQGIRDKLKKIQEIKHSVELSKKNTEKDKAESVELFTALIRCIENSQAELLEMMEEKQKAAERQAQRFIKELEQEIAELKKRDIELEQLLPTDDHLNLLKVHPSVCKNPPTKNWTDIRIIPDDSWDFMKTTLSNLQMTLNDKLSSILKEADLKMMQHYEVDVTLDPETAHPNLILSVDRKQVRYTDTKQELPDNPKRFTLYYVILGKQRFSSGKFYYEVQVSGNTDWSLGVATESVNRKGETTLTPQNGFWTVILFNGNDFWACKNVLVSLNLKEKPQKVGVFVDYEEGLVSLYDVENRSHIYSFTGQSFTEKLYPYFSPHNFYQGQNLAPLIITPMLKAQ